MLLAAWVGALLFFMLVLAPLGWRLPGIFQMAALIETRGIRATAIYYTDIDEFFRAESDLHNRMQYSPPLNHGGQD